VPTPSPAASPIVTDASAMMAATEMSISPAMISSASGNAITARSVKLNVASDSVQIFKKYGDRLANRMTSKISTRPSIDSQRITPLKRDCRFMRLASPGSRACLLADAR
jgi:hypothetical protein